MKAESSARIRRPMWPSLTVQVERAVSALKPLPFGDSDRVHVGDSGRRDRQSARPMTGQRHARDRQRVQRALTLRNHTHRSRDPDGRADQPRQLRRPAAERAGQVVGVAARSHRQYGHRRQHRNRFRDPGQHCARRGRPTDQAKGKVEHAVIGCPRSPVDARSLGSSGCRKSGLLVASVQPGSGAAAAGLRAGNDQPSVEARVASSAAT